MYSKFIAATALASSLVLVPATRVSADAGDFVAGAIIGGIVGHAARKEAERKKRVYRSTTQKRKVYRPSIPATQEGRQIQASLNYFGFNAGSVDGQLGRKSRAAISQYQAYLGYPVTGQLSPFEQDLLISSYNRAQAGGYQTTQLVAQNPEGTRGLLKTYRAELAGQTVPGAVPVPGTTTVVVAAPQAVAPAVGTTTTTTVTAAQPTDITPVEPVAPVETASAAGALPNFLGGDTGKSLASHCNTVSLLTNTNGGFTTVASMSDPMQVMNEQFCLARTYAIAQSEDMVAKVQGFTPDQIAAQCEAFGPAMKDHVAALSLKTLPEVRQMVSGFVLGTGMSPAQLTATAQICLGVGYRTDNMDVALASGLILHALGQNVYGELMGHHLAQGFGAAQRVDLARAWYEDGLNAADRGAALVFSPGQPERTDLLRKASLMLGSTTSAPSAVPQVQPVAAALPNFGTQGN